MLFQYLASTDVNLGTLYLMPSGFHLYYLFVVSVVSDAGDVFFFKCMAVYS